MKRNSFATVVAVSVVLTIVAVACGSATVDSGGGDSSTSTPSTDVPDTSVSVSAVQVADRSSADTNPAIAGQAITTFGHELFNEARADVATENITLSPASIAIALAMLEPGATGDARTQFHDVLHIDDADVFRASVNALEQSLEGREVPDLGPDNDAGELTLRIANAAYLQEGFPFNEAYLETIGANFGPVLNEVDFRTDPDAVAHEINDWVAEQTEDRIMDLIGDGVLTPDHVLALVNALYMNASWFEPFQEASTSDLPFSRLDGSEVTVPLMHGHGDSSGKGDGWVAASKSYTGGLQIQFVLPDEGRFDEVAGRIGEIFEQNPASGPGGTLVVPKFETRTDLELTPPLQRLGLVAPYNKGNLMDVADDPRLVLDQVIHQTFLAIDEQGTEAAAATVVLAGVTSAPVDPPVPVVLDRPFLYRIIDAETGATLFIGQITDPTA
jgi:serpin B